MNFTVCNDIFKIYRLVHRYDYMSNSYLYHEHITLFYDKMVLSPKLIKLIYFCIITYSYNNYNYY